MATAIAVFGLVAAGCGAATETDQTAAGAATPSASAAQGGPQLDPAVFEGDAQVIGGDRFELGELANKDLVLWFWAPW